MSDKITLIEVECCNCHKKFNKTLHRYKESIKMNYRFFCSKECIIKSQTTSVNTQCSRCFKDIIIKRNIFNSSTHKRFFCSTSCSAKYNNKIRGPLTENAKNNIREGIRRYYNTKESKTKTHICLICEKPFRSSKNNRRCCSYKCHSIYKFGSAPYNKDDVINKISNIAKSSLQTPQKRDCESRLYHAAVKFFGTWNKAMEACNLTPNSTKYRRIRVQCIDGHMADSISEKIIDDWLFENNIKHERSKKYPNSNRNCDFYLTDYNVWIEYFGLYGSGSTEYINTMTIKHELVKNNNILFISIIPEDLYSDKTISYGEKLKKLINNFITSSVCPLT